MNEGYTDQLEDGRTIYIPNWPANVQFENLTKVCKVLGQDEVINIATTKNVPAAMIAIMGAEDAANARHYVMHFTQQARIDGEKILSNKMDELGISVIVELFVHVLYSQYNDFFVSGLAKAPSPSK